LANHDFFLAYILNIFSCRRCPFLWQIWWLHMQ